MLKNPEAYAASRAGAMENPAGGSDDAAVAGKSTKSSGAG